jgi:hypothetical protein
VDRLVEIQGDVSEDEIVMAIDMREQQTIGCAYYTASEEKLYLMQDCKFADLTLFDTRTSTLADSRKLILVQSNFTSGPQPSLHLPG